ncbi:MAG: RnfH family protein [Betaproteobacteria bacterium]|nr:RnfH family protein [Betaproteobacteria bacterium]
MAEILITVCFSAAPRQICELTLRLPEGASLHAAVAQASQQGDWPLDWREAGQWQTLAPSIWGRKVGWSTPLRDGDRVALCRGLRVDPKVARRERFSKQGARRAGLFAKKRPGAAAGY